jgi:hypothetical protein
MRTILSGTSNGDVSAGNFIRRLTEQAAENRPMPNAIVVVSGCDMEGYRLVTHRAMNSYQENDRTRRGPG